MPKKGWAPHRHQRDSSGLAVQCIEISDSEHAQFMCEGN